jgi:hypothetical protein
MYTPVDVAQALQDINSQLKEVLAISHNNRLLARNRHHTVPQDYRPLYKTVRYRGRFSLPQTDINYLDFW